MLNKVFKNTHPQLTSIEHSRHFGTDKVFVIHTYSDMYIDNTTIAIYTRLKTLLLACLTLFYYSQHICICSQNMYMTHTAYVIQVFDIIFVSYYGFMSSILHSSEQAETVEELV